METNSATWYSGGQHNKLCRCCLSEGCYKDISTEYFWMGKKEVYADMLSDTFDISISYGQTSGPNSHTRLICEPCIARLRDASEFKKQVVECERSFMQLLAEPGTSTVQDSEAEETEQSVKLEELEEMKVEMLESDYDDFDPEETFHEDDDDDDLDDSPLTRFATKVPKKEAADLLDLIDNSQVTVKRKAPVKAKAPPAKKAKTVKEPYVSKKAAPAKPAEKKKDPGEKGIMRQNAEVIVKFTTAYPFRVPSEVITCVYCAESFPEPDLFREHMKVEHAEFNRRLVFPHISTDNFLKVDITELSCRLCKITFLKLVDAADHLKETHEAPLYLEKGLDILPYVLKNDKILCGICDQNFRGLRPLGRHIMTHFLYHTCETCGKSYSNLKTLGNHKLVCQKNRCLKCHKVFDTIEQKRDHINNSRACWQYKCSESECVKLRFKDFSEKQKHMASVHDITKTYTCPECKEVFANRKLSNEHFRSTHGSLPYHICETCGKSFIDLKTLGQHKLICQKKHCLKCHKVFETNEQKRDHMNNSRTCWQYKCFEAPECLELRFKRFSEKQKHMASVHDIIKTYTCPECKKVFGNRKLYNQHIRSTHGPDPFKCPHCNKSMPDKNSLEQHLASVHDVIKSFTCPDCKEVFATRKLCNEHLRLSHGVDPYKCPYCNKSMRDKNSLNRHLVTHTKEKPFACDHCSRAFGMKWTLAQHLRTHEVIKQYQCKRCDKKFNLKVCLTSHMKSQHPKLLTS